MKSEKEKVVYDSPKGAKNRRITLNHDSGPYPIKLIEENNVESYKFSSYLPECIKTELLYLLKRRGEVFVLGLEVEKEGIQIGITGTGNSKLDNLELRLTMGRKFLKKLAYYYIHVMLIFLKTFISTILNIKNGCVEI